MFASGKKQQYFKSKWIENYWIILPIFPEHIKCEINIQIQPQQYKKKN